MSMVMAVSSERYGRLQYVEAGGVHARLTEPDDERRPCSDPVVEG